MTDGTTDDLDLSTLIDQYRRAVERRDDPHSLAGPHFVQTKIDSIVAQWNAANGGDRHELHETAFGGPPE